MRAHPNRFIYLVEEVRDVLAGSSHSNFQDASDHLEVADGKDYAAVQQIDDSAAFDQLAAINWNNVPATAGDHHVSHLLAAKIRDFQDYYEPEHTHLRSAVEGWPAATPPYTPTDPRTDCGPTA
ncbi:hypothetical protein ACFWNK_21760 [Streptomyces sp. NPDC058417]|uniref:hypothetical protein n=1 Tax=unclassified Streptomyces TaxID=2593676 RepID=UPI003663B2BE